MDKTLFDKIERSRGKIDKIFVPTISELETLIDNNCITLKEGTVLKDNMHLKRNKITDEFEEYKEVIN
jgi:hypothetical protein